MKRIILSVLLAVGGVQAVSAAPWVNEGYITDVPFIDNSTFINRGTIDITTYDAAFTALPFETRNTLYYQNDGFMTCSDGFRFDKRTPTQRLPSVSFVNNDSGLISALDGPLLLNYSRYVNGKSIPIFGGAAATPSYLLVSATGITNHGILSVGAVGLLALTGSNIDLERGIQAAGEPDESMNSMSAISAISAPYLGYSDPLANLYLNPVAVRDLAWGAGGANMDLRAGSIQVGSAGRQGSGGKVTLSFFDPVYPFGYATYVYTNWDQAGSNIYVNVVMVNTNFLDTNIFADVRFTTIANNDAREAIVQFGTANSDIITGRIITNSFYLVDTAASIGAMGTMVNYENANGYSRPTGFKITTQTPTDWTRAVTNNAYFTNSMIFPGNTYTTDHADIQYGYYQAQVGRNPETLAGDTSYAGVSSANITTYRGWGSSPLFKDPTNEAARIEVNASNLDLTGATFRSENMVRLTAKKVVGLDQVSIDSGFIDCDLTDAKSLTISNVIPSHFRRCRGDVIAWCGNWRVVETNAVVTNNFIFHVLVVNSQLQADFRPATPSIALRAPCVNVQDPLHTYNMCYLPAEKLTFNAPVTLDGKLTSFTAANVPKLKTFLNDTNGELTAMSQINIGADTAAGLNCLTNRGLIKSTVISLKSSIFENSGTISATNGGNMYIQANSVLLKGNTAPSGLTYASSNFLSSYGVLQINSGSLKASNSRLVSGLSGHGALKLCVSSVLSDSTPGVPDTNFVLNNFWTNYNGIVIPTKPTYGDLFGTEIITRGLGTTYNTHTWPGIDRGSNVCGFTNNLVIGRLVLDLASQKSTLFFTGAGTKNAMYVDYLEIKGWWTNSQDISLDAILNQYIKIDNNLTIYYADCNFPPDKIKKSHLVWVRDFAGPNSSTNILVHVAGVETNIWVNRALAQSAEIDSNNNGDPNKTDPWPFDGTLLSLNVSGQGTVRPNLTGIPLVLGKKYTFTATPAVGYLFAGWTGGTTNSSPTITLPMTRDLVLNASFVRDHCYFAKGTYKGLYLATNNVSLTNSGPFSFTLNEKGTGSGTFGTNTFTPVFDKNGAATATFKRNGETLTLKLQLDFINDTELVVGTVTGKGWTANVLGNRSVYSAANPSPAKGLYTMTMLGGTNAAITPSGNGYATITVSNTGIAVFAGKLADNLPITPTATIAKNGSLPFYAADGVKEMIIGWLNFDTNDLSSISGNLTWVKQANCGTYYKNGFSMNVEVHGSRYNAPAKAQSVLNITEPVFMATDGNLTAPVAVSPTYTSATYTYSTNKMSLVIAPAKGSFTGSFVNALGKTNQMSGVVLQQQNTASGFFLGTSQSGEVSLSESKSF